VSALGRRLMNVSGKQLLKEFAQNYCHNLKFIIIDYKVTVVLEYYINDGFLNKIFWIVYGKLDII